MERIVIEVDEVVARRWKVSPKELRDKAALLISRLLSSEKEVKYEGEELETPLARDNFAEYLTALRDKMSERGLTQEKLDEILRDE